MLSGLSLMALLGSSHAAHRERLVRNPAAQMPRSSLGGKVRQCW
jgi:hypothetical protein